MTTFQLDPLLEQERKVADSLEMMIIQADREALALDPRKPEEMHQHLPSEHPASARAGTKLIVFGALEKHCCDVEP